MVREINQPTDRLLDSLTEREMETLTLIAEGLSNQDIAKIMVIHENTVAKYVSALLAKLGLTSRTQAALYAIRNGLAKNK
jgi:DNA-binding NarL/FixJ family response regulator